MTNRSHSKSILQELLAFFFGYFVGNSESITTQKPKYVDRTEFDSFEYDNLSEEELDYLCDADFLDLF